MRIFTHPLRASNNWGYFGAANHKLRSGGRSDAPSAWHFTTGDIFRPDPSAQTRPDPLSNAPQPAVAPDVAGPSGLIAHNLDVGADSARTESLFSMEGGAALASVAAPATVRAEVPCECPRCAMGDERVGLVVLLESLLVACCSNHYVQMSKSQLAV